VTSILLLLCRTITLDPATGVELNACTVSKNLQFRVRIGIIARRLWPVDQICGSKAK
jgi:hypothetical protein